MPMPITPELAAFMRSLGYDQLRQAYKEKYGKPYPMFCLSETKISGAELRAQFPGEDLDELIERYTDHRSEEEKRAELDALVDELVRRQNRHAP